MRWLLGLALLVASQSASAQTEVDENRVVARRMAEEAASLYESGQFDGARDLFHRANVLYPAPTLELWEARSLEKLGRLVEAEERYAAAQRYVIQADDPDVVRAAVREAGQEVMRLRRRIPTVTIVLRGADPNDPSVEVQLDGRRVNPAMLGFPKPVDPGHHIARVIVNGRESTRLSVMTEDGDSKRVELDTSSTAPKPTPRPKPEARPPRPADPGIRRPPPWYTRRTTGWISLGVGAAGLAAGATAGLAAVNTHRDLDAQCPNGECPESLWPDVRSFRRLRDLSTVCYVVGGVGVAAGATIVFLLPAKKVSANGATLTVALGPTSATVAGSF